MRLRDLSVGDPFRLRTAEARLPATVGWEVPQVETLFCTLHFWRPNGDGLVTAKLGGRTLDFWQPGETEVQPCA